MKGETSSKLSSLLIKHLASFRKVQNNRKFTACSKSETINWDWFPRTAEREITPPGYSHTRKLLWRNRFSNHWRRTGHGQIKFELCTYNFETIPIWVLNVAHPTVGIQEASWVISHTCSLIFLFFAAKCQWLMKIYWHNPCRLLFHVAVPLSWEFASRSWLKAIWRHSAIQIFKIYHAVFIGSKVWQDYMYTRNW